MCNTKLDLAFLIDTAADIRRGFSYIRKFFLQLVDSFTISSDKVRIGLVINPNRPQVKFSFGQYNNPRKIKRVIRLLRPFSKTRRTGRALKLALKQLFAASKRKKTLIFLTAGKSSDPVSQASAEVSCQGCEHIQCRCGASSCSQRSSNNSERSSARVQDKLQWSRDYNKADFSQSMRR